MDDVRALSTKNNTFVVILPFFLVLAVLRGHSICLWKSKCSSVYRILNYKQFAINIRQLFRLPTCTLYSSKQKINKDFLHVSLKTDVHSCNLHVFIFPQLSDQKNSSNVYVISVYVISVYVISVYVISVYVISVYVISCLRVQR